MSASDPAAPAGLSSPHLAADPAAVRAPLDSVAIAHLWTAQFQHLTSIGVAGAGGVLILLQAALIRSEGRWGLALLLFALTSVLGMYGQISVVDAASAGRMPGRAPRAIRGSALAALGAAGGAALATLAR